MKNDLKEKIMHRRVATCEDDAFILYYNLPSFSMRNKPLPITRAERRKLERKSKKRK